MNLLLLYAVSGVAIAALINLFKRKVTSLFWKVALSVSLSLIIGALLMWQHLTSGDNITVIFSSLIAYGANQLVYNIFKVIWKYMTQTTPVTAQEVEDDAAALAKQAAPVPGDQSI